MVLHSEGCGRVARRRIQSFVEGDSFVWGIPLFAYPGRVPIGPRLFPGPFPAGRHRLFVAGYGLAHLMEDAVSAQIVAKVRQFEVDMPV